MKLYELDEVCEFQSGLWTGKKDPYKVVKVLRNTNFTKDNKLNLENIAEIKVEVKQLEKRILEKGDILIEKSGGGPKQPVGRVVFIDKRAVDYSFSNFTSRIRVSSDDLNPNYLYWFLNYIYLSGKTENLQRRSTGIRNLQLKEYKQLVIPVPSLQEQEKIVERLDKVFENISEKLKIEKLRKEELSTLAKSIYDELFNFNSNNLTTLSNLVEFENGDRGKNYPSKKYRVKSGIPFINAGNFNLDGKISEEKIEYISDEHYNKLSRGKVRKNDFLLCIRGSLGKFAINNHYSKAAIASSLVIIRPNKLDNIEMLDKYFRSSFFKKQITEKSGGTAQPNLGANQLKDFLIPSSLSKKDLYRARKIDILLKQYFENNQNVIEKVNLLKTSLLNKEFSYE